MVLQPAPAALQPEVNLEPKPAIHANIAFEQVPTEYLYNMINYGGAAMGIVRDRK